MLEAQIVELKEKPSLPIGEVGVDAFGHKPYYEDRGIIKAGDHRRRQAGYGTGQHDSCWTKRSTSWEAVSDHIILDVTKSDREYKVGDIVRFTLGYGGMLKTATSPYVEKTYINKSRL